MRRAITTLLLCLCAIEPAVAQIRDDFSDGDLSSDPAWIGALHRWQTGVLAGSVALQSNGAAESDTIHLALASHAAFGRWEFTFAHTGVNLSTFNGARIFLSTAYADSSGPVEGYFVQIGTNNSDLVSLWRVDGGLDRRVELGRSAEVLADGDSSYLRVSVDRDGRSKWTVSVDGAPIIEVTDDRYQSGNYFVIWVKHTAQGAQSFYFDDLRIEAVEIEPPEPEPPPRPPGPTDLVINEIQFDPLPGSSEFIELYNRSDSTIDLRTVTFRDSRSPPLEIVDSKALLEPGGFAVIVADHDAFEAQFRRTPYIAPSRWAALNNGGDSVLIEAGGEIIDSVTYVDDVSPTGFALERIDPDGPSDAYNFSPSFAPFGATPGAINSTYEPDNAGPVLVFAEEWDAGVLELYFDEPVDPSTMRAENIEAGDVRPDSVRSVDDRTFAAYFSTLGSASRIDLTGIEDRRGNRSEMLSLPIAFLPTTRDLVINEIMFEPLADSYDGFANQAEYIEILNRSDRLLTLSGLLTTRRPDEHGDADTMDISLSLSSLGPGEMYLVASDTSLPSLIPDVLMLHASALSLPNGGDVACLRHLSGILIDSMAYDQSLHHPDLMETRGVALERVDPDGDSGDTENWTSSVDPSGGTPGRQNSIRLAPLKSTRGVSISPNPFSPNRDGVDDIAAITFDLSSGVSLIRVRIFDRSGFLVRELVKGQLVAGSGTIYWDGLDDLGRRLRLGVYVVLFEAFDDRRSSVEAFKAVVVLAG